MNRDQELSKDLSKMGMARPAYPRFMPALTGKPLEEFLRGYNTREVQRVVYGRPMPVCEAEPFSSTIVEDIQMVLSDLRNWGNRKVESFAHNMQIELYRGTSYDPVLSEERRGCKLLINYTQFRNLRFEARYNLICNWVTNKLKEAK